MLTLLKLIKRLAEKPELEQDPRYEGLYSNISRPAATVDPPSMTTTTTAPQHLLRTPRASCLHSPCKSLSPGFPASNSHMPPILESTPSPLSRLFSSSTSRRFQPYPASIWNSPSPRRSALIRPRPLLYVDTSPDTLSVTIVTSTYLSQLSISFHLSV
ncbi:hypothetical protein L208DRAFT_1400671 [Tricholoma matsutake]|nr:hypothetical protein L208DRAFT_1400671 [Tricholoma matsutake 945]